MALSKALAQDIVQNTCNLCENEEDVNWFCKDCAKSLCQLCKVVHSKIPSCECHSIISIFEGLKITKFLETKCRSHKEIYQFYCRTCQNRICSECLTQSHKQHDFTRLTNYAQNLKTNFTKKLRRKESEVENLQQALGDLEQIIQTYKEQMGNCQGLVKAVASGKKKEIELWEEMFLSDIETEENKKVKKLNVQYESLIKQVNEQQIIIQDIKKHQQYQTLDASSIDFMLSAEAQLDSLHISKTIEVPNPPVFKVSTANSLTSQEFGSLASVAPYQILISSDTGKEGTLKTKTLKATILKMSTLKKTLTKGCTEDIPKSQTLPPMKSSNLEKTDLIPEVKKIPQSKNSFRAGKSSEIISLTLIADDRVWIGFQNGTLKLVNNFGKVYHKVKLATAPWYTAYITEPDQLLVSARKMIQKVTIKGDVSNFATLESCNKICRLVTTERNQVFACVNIYRGNYKVVRLTSDGKIDLELDSSLYLCKNPQLLFCTPDGNICVFSDDKLVLMDQDGRFIRNVNWPSRLSQVCITNDCHGNIITGQGKSIHFFDKEVCSLLCSYRLNNMKGTDYVSAICADRNGKLWIAKIDHIIIVKYID